MRTRIIEGTKVLNDQINDNSAMSDDQGGLRNSSLGSEEKVKFEKAQKKNEYAAFLLDEDPESLRRVANTGNKVEEEPFRPFDSIKEEVDNLAQSTQLGKSERQFGTAMENPLASTSKEVKE